MSKYWNETTKNIEPYVPGEQPRDKKYIKLNTNESPYPPSPKVIKAIKREAGERLRLYPDPTCDILTRTLAEHNGLENENIFIGNGSDEVLAFAFMAFFDASRPILFADITYSFYIVYARLFNLKYTLVRTDDDFNLNPDDYCVENGGVVIANPNAPTSREMKFEELIKIIEFNRDRVVIIDEAYVDFGGRSAAGLVKKYPNLLVIQTLSKSRALAGLRVGFAFGHKELIEGLNRIKNSINSYTIDRLAIAGAVEAIKDVDYFDKLCAKVIATRDKFVPEFVRLGFKVIDSKANFIFVSHNRVNAGKIFEELKRNGVLVRYFNKPRINNYLRISIGTDREMTILIKKLSQIIDQQGAVK